MLYHALQVIADEVNAFLRSKLAIERDVVLLAPLADPAAATGNDALLLTVTLFSLEMEPLLATRQHPGAKGVPAAIAEPPFLPVAYALLSTSFPDGEYAAALELLSEAMSFLHRKSVFTAVDTPNLPPELDRLLVDFVQLGLEQTAAVWSAMGLRHRPAVFYRIRMHAKPEGLSRSLPGTAAAPAGSH